MDQIILSISSKIRLSPSTQFLARYLAKNYLYFEVLSQQIQLTAKEITTSTYSACFLASKMRERDIYCPMISHFIRASGNQLSYDEMRAGEMRICRFFDWNLSMMTYYDFLEQFLAQGVLTQEDTIFSDSTLFNQNTPDGKFKSPTGSQPKTFYTPSP